MTGKKKKIASVQVSAEVVEHWDHKLRERLKAIVAAGDRPEFTIAKMNMTFQLKAINKDKLTLDGGGMAMTYAFDKLSLPDRAALVVAFAKRKQAEDCALAAFYLYATGKTNEGKAFLADAGEFAAEIQDAFAP